MVIENIAKIIEAVGKTGDTVKDQALECIATFYANQDLPFNGMRVWTSRDFAKFNNLIAGIDTSDLDAVAKVAAGVRSIQVACGAVDNELAGAVKAILMGRAIAAREAARKAAEAKANEPAPWWDTPGGSRPGQCPAWTGD